MARMIPSFIPESCRSPGEREIFELLLDDPDTKDWIVLHSLDIAHHRRQVTGEVDFVIVIPKFGVLCLEVKASNSVRREDGLWYYGKEERGDPRGPFKQSSEGMHSLRQHVVRSDHKLSRVPFWSAVAFPSIEFTVTSDEWHSWQVIDATKLCKSSLPKLVLGIMRNARLLLDSQPSVRWFNDEDRFPNKQQAAAIARILRPNFEFLEKATDRQARKHAEILRYTEEQFIALDAMTDNERVLFSGPAGTGKTLLALEATRRAADSGKKVLFICFNRLLGRWVSSQAIAQRENVTVRTLHQHLLSVAGIPLPIDVDDTFWKVDLPDAAVAKLLESNSAEAQFDVLIVDELQDLLNYSYLDVFDLTLKGSLKQGSWMFFGDFERQMLYGQDRDLIDRLFRERLGTFARFSLRVNCRNTPRIATLSYLLGRLSPGYSRILRPDDRVEPTIMYYSTRSQQQKQLVNILDQLDRDNYPRRDIVILSPKVGIRSASASITDKRWANNIAPYDGAVSDSIRYTTIHSFKGLDAPVIVITDIEKLEGDIFSSLFYVATTRALERLYIMVHETAKPHIIQSLLNPSAKGKPEC
ncbi:NERD domain-containing protein [Saccharospirillum sp. HFRX-1]|uniref:nuclease-related domain-containing DEAD/DEAH box helicase n=1 Tax=unclassified Saccharospirillum TaxID=2633430 RepID=UPI003724A839